jgi:hypothetical protein
VGSFAKLARLRHAALEAGGLGVVARALVPAAPRLVSALRKTLPLP